MKTAPIFDVGIPPDDCLLHSMVYPEAVWEGLAVIDWYDRFWNDPECLRDFFKENDELIQGAFWQSKNMTRNKAIRQVKDEAREFFERLSAIDEQFEQQSNAPLLHGLFSLLHKDEKGGSPFQYKAKPWHGRPDPMLRLYGIKLASGQMLITGAGIKLTKDMGGEHGMPTLQAELDRIEMVKQFIQQHHINCTADFLEIDTKD